MEYSLLNNEFEIFFPTKDRDDGLVRCIDSVFKYCPEALITIGNCSTDTNKTSEVLKTYGNKVKEIILSHQTSISASFQILIKNLSKKYCLWLSDDVEIIKDINEPLSLLSENKNLKVVGIPMIDIINYHENWPSWPIDEYGCANWILKGLRVGHFAFVESESLKKILNEIQSNSQIDLAVHNKIVNENNYIFMKGDAFIRHSREMDQTRKNRKL